MSLILAPAPNNTNLQILYFLCHYTTRTHKQTRYVLFPFAFASLVLHSTLLVRHASTEYFNMHSRCTQSHSTHCKAVSIRRTAQTHTGTAATEFAALFALHKRRNEWKAQVQVPQQTQSYHTHKPMRTHQPVRTLLLTHTTPRAATNAFRGSFFICLSSE